MSNITPAPQIVSEPLRMALGKDGNVYAYNPANQMFYEAGGGAAGTLSPSTSVTGIPQGQVLTVGPGGQLVGMDISYVHIQTFMQPFRGRAAGPVWVINHNLNQQFVQVQVISFGGNIMVPDIVYNSANQCTLYFANSVSGTAIVRR